MRLDRQALIWELAWSPSGEWIVYRLLEILEGLGPGGIARFDDPVLWVVNTTDNEVGKPIEATRGLAPSYLDWVPEGFLSVSPSAEKQTTLWSRLKQSKKK